jgi:mRNA interferase MazF
MALIAQDDVFDATTSVTVAPLTCTPIEAPLGSIRIGASALSGPDETAM